jgi:hypothetical protein
VDSVCEQSPQEHPQQPQGFIDHTVRLFDINYNQPLSTRIASVFHAGALVHVITMPPKVWRPKPPSRYIPLEYGDEIDDDLFIFRNYGKALSLPKSGATIPERDDIIYWDAAKHQAKFDQVITIQDHIPPDIRSKLTAIIQDNWDCFAAEGVHRPVLGVEFHIDTGGAQPVCCKQPSYGVHEGPIMQKSIDALLSTEWIRKCGGPWGSKGILAGKPHQEEIWNIEDYIWRFCVNYRPLNAVTLPYEFPIPRCDNALDDFGDADGEMCFISVDGKSVFHQIRVALCDQEKLAFFAPDGYKYCFTVMPFGPRNCPAVYTAISRIMQDEWDALFRARIKVKLTRSGTKTIIDDTLLYGKTMSITTQYFDASARYTRNTG